MPLLVNLVIAGLLRGVLPYTVAEGGERYRYYLMHAFYPIRDCSSFHCFRILPPMLASLLPLGTLDAFLVTGFLFQVAAGTMLFMVAEYLHGSRRVALLTTCWFWISWGPMHSFSDPLLIADPVQAFWSFAALYLLLTERYAAALPFLIVGAAVKEGVLLVPAIYAVYAWFTMERTARRVVWSALLVALPAAAWLALRSALHRWFGYNTAGDGPYVQTLYFFTGWVPSLGPGPERWVTAALYIYGTFGAAWVLGVLGLKHANRHQRVLSLAAIPAMAFLAIYQSPDRALACFPYVVLIPAALYIRRLPAPLIAVLFFTNAALSVVIRRGAAFWWLPRTPVLIAAFAALIVAVIYATRLEAAAADGDQPAATPRRLTTSPIRERVLIAVTVSLAAVLSGWMLWRGVAALPLPVAPMTAASEAASVVDDEGGTPGLAVSPDGSRVVLTATRQAGRELWLRPADDGAGEALAGTAGASEPFWSPDGRSIGFFADDALKTIALDTRAVTTLTAAPAARGGAWSSTGQIVFAPDRVGALLKVAASGGAATPATTVGAARERAHGWPSFLPDGDHFLFLAAGALAEDRGLHVGSLATGQSAPIDDRSQPPVHAVFNAMYAAPGYLFFARPDGVWMQPFDARRRMALAERVQFTDGVAWTPDGRGALAVGGRTFLFATRAAEAGGPASVMMSGRWNGTLVNRRP